MTTVAHVCDTNLPAALDLLARRDLASLLVEKVVPLDRAVEDALVPMAEGSSRGKLLVDTEVTA
jgi:(R,R)-butanediol dehydrogenase/meso-butanediol dehydrogenase/diacetyl reductase